MGLNGNQECEVPAFKVESGRIKERQFLVTHVFIQATDQQEIITGTQQRLRR